MKLPIVFASALIAAAPAFGLTLTYTTTLSGPNENPANASPGTGTGMVVVDTTGHTLRVQQSFSGLTGTTTASHIHCCVTVPGGNAGVATQTPSFVGFPLGVTSGSMDQTFSTTAAGTYNPAFVTLNGGSVAAAEAALFAGLEAGTTYLNIHTSAFPNGEIRGFLTPVAAIPEPETYALLLGGLGLLGVAARRADRRARRSRPPVVGPMPAV